MAEQSSKEWWAEQREENEARIQAKRAGQTTYISPKLQRESAERDKNDVFDDSPLVPIKTKEESRIEEIHRDKSAIAVRTGLTFAEDLRPEMQLAYQRESQSASARVKKLNQKIRSSRGRRYSGQGYQTNVWKAQAKLAKKYGLVTPIKPTAFDAGGIRGNEEVMYRRLVGGKGVRTQRQTYAGKKAFNLYRVQRQRTIASAARFRSVGKAVSAYKKGKQQQIIDRNLRYNKLVKESKKGTKRIVGDRIVYSSNPVNKIGIAPGSQGVVGVSVMGTPGIVKSPSGSYRPVDKINITGAYVSPGSEGVVGFEIDKPIYQKPLTDVEIARKKADTNIEIAMGTFDFGTSTGSALFEAQKKRPDKVKEPKKTAVTQAFEGADKWLAERIRLNYGVTGRDEIINTGLAISKGVVDIGATAINLAALGGSKLTELVTGKDPGAQQIRITETSPVSSGIGAGVDSLLSGGGFSSFQAAKEAFVSKAHEMGRGATFGDVFFYAAPLATLPAPVAIAKIGQSSVLVGKIGGTIIPIATKTGKVIKPGFNISGIGKGDFAKIAQTMQKKAKSGTELDSLGIPTVKLITSDKGLKKFLKAGVITKDQFEFVQAGRIAVEKSRRLPQKTFRDKFPDQPFSEVQAGKETKTVLEFFRKKKLRLEGSSIDMFANIKRYQTQAGDFDVKFIKEAVAKTHATELTGALNKLGGRKFSSSGGKISVEKLEGAISKKTKIGEFLDPESAARTGQLSTSKTVMGFKISKKGFKKEDIKFRGGRFQTQRMIASITSLQPKKGGGFDFLPPMNVPGVGSTRAKDFPKAFARVKTEAQIARESLLHKGKAEPLEKAAAVIRKRGEKYINFEEFWKKRALDKPTATLSQESGTTSSIVNAIGASGSKVVSTGTKASPGSGLIRQDTKAPSKIPLTESKVSKPSIISTVSKSKTSSIISKVTKITKSPSKILSSKTASRSVKSLSPSPRSLSPSRSLTSKISGISPTSPTSPGSKSPASPLSPGSPTSPTGRAGGQAVSSLVSVAAAKPLLLPVESTKRILPPILWDSQTPDPKPRPPKPRADFIGNVSEVRISEGIKKKYDIKYGRIRTAKISRKDIRKSRLGIFVKAPKKRTIPERKIEYILSESPKKKGGQPSLLVSHVGKKIRL